MHQELIIDSYLFKQLQQSPDKLYDIYEQPKMKYGDPQVNKDGTLRMRKITSPVYRLKIVQQNIDTWFKEFELPGSMYGGVPGRNNFDNAVPHKNNNFFLSIDLRNFFGNITNSVVHQTLVSNGFTREEASFITRITTFKGSLPQGAPTSTTLANMSFAPVALLLENFCQERNITFTVFVDDLTFSSKKCFKNEIGDILLLLKNNGFYVNHKKIHYKKHSFEITGLYVKRGKLHLHREVLKNIHKPGIKEYIHAFNKNAEKYQIKKAALLS
ncbi:MAG: reverse transcriptase family protein [Bacteroidota bacterium]|nr:reverse transcriptase family protein [Bacteroidota bacterium]